MTDGSGDDEDLGIFGLCWGVSLSACSFLAFFGLLFLPSYKVRDAVKSWRSRRRAAGR